jgi:cell division transport system permease protein
LSKETLEGNAAVGEVLYQADLAQSLQDWTRSIRYAGWISIITLSCTSLLAVMVTTGMNVAAHRKSISVMRLIGATQWFVKAPYVYAGMYIGVIGAVAGYGLCLAGLYVIEPWLISFLRGIISFPLPWQFFAAQAGVSVVVGAVLGALASSAAVDRMLRHA